MHSETLQDRRQLNSAFNDWCAWIQTFLPADKWETFSKLITLPVPTNQQVETIFTELNKVFEGQDAQKQLFFTDQYYTRDAEEYAQKRGLDNFVKTKVWDAVKLQPCSYVVIDMPRTQISERPEPYAYILDVAKVFDVDINTDRLLEYIFFYTGGPNSQIAVIDEESYWIFERPDQGGEYVLVFRSQHSYYDANGTFISGVGFTPVCKVYSTATKVSKYIDSIGPVSNVLSDLDWWWFKKISHRYLGLYAEYPIIVAYREKCDYRNEQGNECFGGRTEFTDGDKSVWRECPKCIGRKTIGAGSFWTAPAPRNADEFDLLQNPIKIIEVSNDKLEFGKNQLEADKISIFKSCVGYDGEPTNDQAQNEKQVVGAFESRDSVLDRIKANLDVAETFIYTAWCRMRYGKLFLGCNINKGTQFYLQTPEQADEAYEKAKTAGKPMHELAALRELANKIKNRNNPQALQRVIIMQQLEPWCDLDMDQVDAFSLNVTNPEQYYIKLNFVQYIDRFEREETSIVEFGSAIDFGTKIKAIQSVLAKYAAEDLAKAKPLPVSNNRNTVIA